MVLIAIRITLILLGTFVPAAASMAMSELGQGQEKGAQPAVVQIKEEDINPHWDKQQCVVCHKLDSRGAAAELRSKDERQMCVKCHANDITHKYIHPDGLSLTKNIKRQLKENWEKGIRLDQQGKLTCMTCHDLTIQCQKISSYTKKLNPKFLREGPYSHRYDICYKCHDQSKYERMNSHAQIAEDGTVRVNKCRLCHEIRSGAKIKVGMKRDSDKFPIIRPLGSDRLLLCIRCHKKIDHPSGAFTVKSINEYRHFITITSEKRHTLEETTKTTGVVLPLEPNTDRIYCATCHERLLGLIHEGE